MTATGDGKLVTLTGYHYIQRLGIVQRAEHSANQGPSEVEREAMVAEFSWILATPTTSSSFRKRCHCLLFYDSVVLSVPQTCNICNFWTFFFFFLKKSYNCYMFLNVIHIFIWVFFLLYSIVITCRVYEKILKLARRKCEYQKVLCGVLCCVFSCSQCACRVSVCLWLAA